MDAIGKRFSIITPSFNQSSYLQQCINSVSSNQVYCQHIIVDGSSSDDSLKVIKENEDQLFYWISEPDNGQSHAINKGIVRSTGEIINWLNADDFYESQSLHAVSSVFEDQKINVVIGRCNIVKNGQVIGQSSGTDIYPANLVKTIGWARIDQPETFFRKSVLDEIGNLNEDLHYVMDKDLWIRYLLRFGLNGIKKIPDVIANFRIHDNSKTSKFSDNFHAETNSLYYAIASANALEDEAKFIFQNLLVDDKIYFSYSNYKTSNKLSKSIIHYFLLYSADYFYFKGDRELSFKITRYIDPIYIDPADYPILKRLIFRTSFLPFHAIKLIKCLR